MVVSDNMCRMVLTFYILTFEKYVSINWRFIFKCLTVYTGFSVVSTILLASIHFLMYGLAFRHRMAYRVSCSEEQFENRNVGASNWARHESEKVA